MTRKQMAAAGIPIPPRASKAQHDWNGAQQSDGRPTQAGSNGHGAYPMFDAMCKAYGLPAPVHEFEFAAELGRHWRVDYLFDSWLALEIEGGVWAAGRHVRGQGFLDDIEKYNALTMLGYALIRCTPADVQSGAAFDLVRRALASSGAQP
jgi:hypothetical protein